LQKLAATPADPFQPAHPGSEFPSATPGAEDIEL
jgi:catalase